MDSKKKFCGATTHTRFAPLPKIFLFLICFLIFNCGVVFGSSTVKYDLEDFINKCDYLTEEAKTKIKTTSYFISAKQDNINYDYILIKIFDNSLLAFYFTNNSELTAATSEYGSNYNDTFTFDKGYCFQLNGGTRNNSKTMSINNSSIEFFYTEVTLKNVGSFRANKVGLPYPTIEAGYQKNNGSYVIDMSNVNYLDGYEPIPEKPWFEFAAEKIGTTTLENEDGNINVYYPTSFRGWANSYTSGKEIGFLYVPKGNTNYNTTFSYLTKSNLSMTQNWEYTNNSIFKKEETSTYTKYSINLENYLITTPYFYNIRIDNKKSDEDINIKFVIINQPTTGTGGIITDNDGNIISGDTTKNETTIGDIQNTITEPYNPNNSILNNMTSGDILENMGYEQNEDPNQDLWDTIINGLKETLTGSGEQTFSFKLRKTEHTISSEDIYIPDGVIKTFISLFVNFWLLMQMFQFIKRTIDQINEGNMKVMDTVDADCYFF